MESILTGGIVALSIVAGLFFFRFWHTTRDRFFLYFALSFWIEAGNRLALGLLPEASELNPLFYVMRIVAYGLIIIAIWQKNRPRA